MLSAIEDLDLTALPSEFVAKPTHMSGEIRFVPDKSDLEVAAFRATVQRWLASASRGATYGAYWVNEMPRQVIFEERLRDSATDVPLDYKFFVFRGEVRMIQMDVARFAGHTRRLLTPDWEVLPVEYNFPAPVSTPVDAPHCLPEMIDVARALGREFDFMRVDLYAIDGRSVVFGELTPAPEAGRGRFVPRAFDFEFGRHW